MAGRRKELQELLLRHKMTKKYSTLYHKDTTGNIRVWWLEQDNESYRTHSGINGGQIVTSNWIITNGKNLGRANATTPAEQATKEILAKYKKQKESGYHEKIEDVDKTTFFKPMLAHKYLEHKDKIDWSNGAWVSPKLDGVRCIINKDSAFSRTGKPFVSFPHITEELKLLFHRYPNLILDGEIYTHKFNKDFNKIISLAKKTKPTINDLKESKKHLQYWVFDTPSSAGEFSKRYDTLKTLFFNDLYDNKYIKLCPHMLRHNESDVEMRLERYLADGYEGIMINTAGGLYEHKRSYNLLKYKLFMDSEFEILDITEGIGNRSGMFGRAVLKTKNGDTFEANARGNVEFYKQLLANKNLLKGKFCTVRYQNITPGPNGVPRFPVIVAIREYE